jgi:hypothetical protein
VFDPLGLADPYAADFARSARPAPRGARQNFGLMPLRGKSMPASIAGRGGTQGPGTKSQGLNVKGTWSSGLTTFSVPGSVSAPNHVYCPGGSSPRNV